LANYYNTAGLTFKKLKQYDRAIEHFNKSLEIVQRDSIYTWVGLLAGNIGSVYYDMGDVNKAIPLLEKDLQLSYESHSYASAANASQFLAKIFLEEGDFGKAESYYHQALDIDKKSPRLTLAKDVNEGLYNLYKKTGKTTKALMYHEQFVTLRDSLERQNKVEQLKRLELKFQYEKSEQERQAEINSLQQEQAASQKTQYAIIAGALLLLISIGLLFYAYRQRSQRKQVVTELELESNRKELVHYTERLIQKTNLVEELNQQLDNIRAMGEGKLDNRTELLSKLIDSTILTDDEWSDFKKIFDQVHRGFFARIRDRYTDLTEGEIRLIALLKLNLSSKEIANMLGISVDSVIKSRYRLRKKIGTEADFSLEQFVTSV
jgi:tetratricopeptide (TPR) repeat protein